jgi:hypothetical protein
MLRIIPRSLTRNDEIEDAAPSEEALRTRLEVASAAVLTIITTLSSAEHITFREAERQIRASVFALGCAAMALFLGLRERYVVQAHQRGGRFEWFGRTYRRAPAIGRNLMTLFGVVRYHRMYMREVVDGPRHGFHPLDVSLGLASDRLSFNVLSLCVRLATKMAFAESRETLLWFVPTAPSTEVIEQAVLGFGRHTADWFEQAPAPHDDGEVLVIQIDGKGAPTATDAELARRRRPHRKRGATSPRHRGRDRRSRYPSKPRRNKGDKSKNAKMATMVVLYTLRRVGTRRLEGPVNVRFYASFAPKRHAFEMAKRMADTRGFGPDSGRLIQLVTDGDEDFARLRREFFPNAEHTLDYYHVLERIYTAGECLHREGSDELRQWVDAQKVRLFSDQADDIIAELRTALAAIPATGPGNKGRRERLEASIGYLDKRIANIRYGSLRRRDLEISSGAVEGAIKRVIGRRCDHGGMRWIKERVEHLLQLRCIEVAGDWDHFEKFVHERIHAQANLNRESPRIQAAAPLPLPEAA